MSQTPWYIRFKEIVPYIFEIRTPLGSGTGFQLFSNEFGICGVATAYHVIEHANDLEETIKVTHYGSNQSLILKGDPSSRVIFAYQKEDLAFIVFPQKDLKIKPENPDLMQEGYHLFQGNEIAWCGFPSVAKNKLCFFAGHISCYIEESKIYLIDGVVINGVSGGPVFYENIKTKKPEICGVVTNYAPNRISGETLPGLGVVRKVDLYQKTLKTLKSLDEARRIKKAGEKKSEATH